MARKTETETRFERYRRKQLDSGMVRVTGYVHETDRDRALAYLKRLRDAARLLA